MFDKLPKKVVLTLLNFYPPFLGAGIKIKTPKKDFTEFDVSMPLRFYNKNYVGVQFGGSLYSMCDPFFMLIAMEKLGSEYLVWDKKASIQFIKPGRSRVHAHFSIDDSIIEEVKKCVEKEGKHTFDLKVKVLSESDELVSVVHKTLWVSKKRSS